MTEQRSADLEQDARQQRFAMEVDVPSTIVTRNHTEDVAEDQAKHGDTCSAKMAQAGPASSTSFGVNFTGPPALPFSRDDALVGNSAAAPKWCISPSDIRTPTATGGLLPTGKASTTTRINYYQSLLRFCVIEETNYERTSIQYVTYYSSFWWINNQRAAPFWRRIMQTKLRQTLIFDPGDSTGRLHACPFLGTWRALFCEKVLV